MEYDPGVPTFKHSDKFESRALVKMMQKEATLAERAWEERTSQRDNNKVYFNHLTREEAKIEMRLRMEKYDIDQNTFNYSVTGEKIGTRLLRNYHSDLASTNHGMKDLRKSEKLKEKTEKLIAKAVEKKTGNVQDIQCWPPPEFPDAEVILNEDVSNQEAESKPVEIKKRKALPQGLARRLAAKRKVSVISDSQAQLADSQEKAAKLAMAEIKDFSIPGFDAAKLKALLDKKTLDLPHAKKKNPVMNPKESVTGISYVNMPSEIPLNIPGLPAGWKFGDKMPTGYVAEEKPNVALEIAQSTKKKRKRPEQPVIFQADAMGALVDPTQFNTSIEQDNLTPKQPGYYIQKRKEEEKVKLQQEQRLKLVPKVITAAPKMSTGDQYSSSDFKRTYSAGSTPQNGRVPYGEYQPASVDISKYRNKYNRYKGAGVSGGGYR